MKVLWRNEQTHRHHTGSMLCLVLQLQYAELVSEILGLPYSLLNVKARAWFEDYGSFKSRLEDLEKQLTRVLQQGFDAAGTLAAKLHLLPVHFTLLVVTSVEAGALRPGRVFQHQQAADLC